MGAELFQIASREDAALDTQIRAQIDASIAAIAAIPAPFGTAIFDDGAAAAIENAQAAIRSLQTLLDTRLLPLVQK